MAASSDPRGGGPEKWASPDSLASAAREAARRLITTFPDVSEANIEDAVSEALQYFLKNGLQCDGDPTKLILRRATWNLYRTLRSQRWRSPTPPGGIEHIPDPNTETEEQAAYGQALQAVLDQNLVSRRSRMVLTLWSLGYRAREIAIRLHMKTVTVRKKKERVLRKIRERLGLAKPPK